ncbi:MAG: ATP synthase F1 subunit gamma [Limnochordaceae bacterium]|nr:ATP synthase F1 subunit gamma [Limnochordaceae bacterium]
MAGQSTRDIKRRIQSVQSTQQVTKAMEMVSAAKLRRAQGQVVAARPFANRIADVLARVVSTTLAARPELARNHPLLQQKAGGRTLVCAIAADRGLAGGYNANLGRALDAVLRLEEQQGGHVEVVAVGRKVRDWLRRAGRPAFREFLYLGDEVSFTKAREIARSLVEPFVAGQFDRVALLFSQFVSSVVHRPVLYPLLPIPQEGPKPMRVNIQGGGGPVLLALDGERPGAEERAAGRSGERAGRHRQVERWQPPYIYEPSVEDVIGVLLERYLDVEVYRALIEAKASEHGARMTAMHNASDNAEEMIESLTLSFNRARQAGITREIAEIVGGAEALAAQI